MTHSTPSMYTLDTVNYNDDDNDDSAPLLTPTTPSYGATFPRSRRPSSTKVIFNATLKMACIFLISTVLLSGTLWLALPTLEEYVLLFCLLIPPKYSNRDDRPMLKIPKSFAQLQDLNGLLKKYRDIYPYRIVICYVTTYLLLVASLGCSLFC